MNLVRLPDEDQEEEDYEEDEINSQINNQIDNDDFDEFIFYHRGQFFSRDNIHPGMTTLHPCGFTHGPHPGAFATATNFSRKETDEVAVMVDTRDALEIGDKAASSEWAEYSQSWNAVEKP